MQTTKFLFNAKRMTLNYGELPSFEDFEQMWLGDVGPERKYQIRNCRELDAVYPNGDVDLDLEEMWELLESCVGGWQDNHEMGDIASCILQTFGVEWV